VRRDAFAFLLPQVEVEAKTKNREYEVAEQLAIDARVVKREYHLARELHRIVRLQPPELPRPVRALLRGHDRKRHGQAFVMTIARRAEDGVGSRRVGKDPPGTAQGLGVRSIHRTFGDQLEEQFAIADRARAGSSAEVTDEIADTRHACRPFWVIFHGFDQSLHLYTAY